MIICYLYGTFYLLAEKLILKLGYNLSGVIFFCLHLTCLEFDFSQMAKTLTNQTIDDHFRNIRNTL